jgi:hypothetical protein
MTDQPVQPEATTKAGQAMEAWLREPENYEWGRKVTNAILAIEAEAVAAFVTRPESKFGASQARQIALEAAQIAREFAAVMDRLTDALASQERPSIDVADLTRLLGETGWYIEDDEGNELAYDVAADWIARLAGGSVASPEPSDG